MVTEVTKQCQLAITNYGGKGVFAEKGEKEECQRNVIPQTVKKRSFFFFFCILCRELEGLLNVGV